MELALVLTVVLVGVLVAALIARRKLVVIRVKGRSMTPTLLPGQRVLARRHRSGPIAAGQIIVAAQPQFTDAGWRWPQPVQRIRDSTWLIKRVAAGPGDPAPAGVDGLAVGSPVPPGMFVLLGDNGAASTDSRDFGAVPGDRILGVVIRNLRLTYRDDTVGEDPPSSSPGLPGLRPFRG